MRAVLCLPLATAVSAGAGEWVRVPGGLWVHESCITHVPDGGHADPPPCAHPTHSAAEWSPGPADVAAPDVQCYDQKATYAPAGGGNVTQMNASFVVPPLPTELGSQTVFLWPGFKARQPKIGRPVLQPVLQYYGGKMHRWQLQSWAVGIPGGAMTGPAIDVSPGDSITSHMVLVDDEWTIFGKNHGTGKSTTLHLKYSRAGGKPYSYAVFVSENVMRRHKCDLYPANNGITFTGVRVNGADGAPGWEAAYDCGSPDCGQKVVIGDGGKTVELTWAHAGGAAA